MAEFDRSHTDSGNANHATFHIGLPENKSTRGGDSDQHANYLLTRPMPDSTNLAPQPGADKSPNVQLTRPMPESVGAILYNDARSCTKDTQREVSPGVYRREPGICTTGDAKSASTLAGDFQGALAASENGKNPGAFNRFNENLKASVIDSFQKGGKEGANNYLNALDKAIPQPGVGIKVDRDGDKINMTAVDRIPKDMDANKLADEIASGKAFKTDSGWSHKVGDTASVDTSKIDRSAEKLQALEKEYGPTTDRTQAFAKALVNDLNYFNSTGHQGISENWARQAAKLAEQYGGAGALDIANAKMNEALKESGYSVQLKNQSGVVGLHGPTCILNTVTVKDRAGQPVAIYEDGHDTVRSIGPSGLNPLRMNVYPR